MKKHYLMLLILLCLMLASSAFGANISPTDTSPAGQPVSYSWTLATNQTVTGDSDTAIDVQYCKGPKALMITTSGGSVSIAFTIVEDGASISQYVALDGTPTNITSATAQTLKFSRDSNIGTFTVTSTITSGTVASITLRCN